MPTSVASPSVSTAGVAASENGPSCFTKRLIAGACAPRSANTGVAWSANPPRRTIVGRSSRRNGGRRWRSASRSARRSAVASRHLGGVLERGGDAAALAGQRRQHGVAVARQLLQRVVLRGEDRQHLVDLAQRRVGAADDLVEVGAAAGDARAELVEDDRQARLLRLARDVVDQVEVDRLARVLDRQQVLALALAVLDLLQLRGRLRGGLSRLRRLALDELLADQRLRADHALGVAAEVLVALVLDVEHDDGLEVVRDVERVDLADLDAGHLHVLAGDDEARAVEDGADLVALVVSAREQHDHHRGGDREHERDGGDGSHGPGSTRLGSQSSGPRLPLSV